VPILLRQLIISRIDLLFISALRFAKQIASVWAVIFLSSFCRVSFVYAEPVDTSSKNAVTIVQSESSGSYAAFNHKLGEIFSRREIFHIVMNSSRPIPNSSLVVTVGMEAATVVALSDAPVILNVLLPKANHLQLLRDIPRRCNSRMFSTLFLDQSVNRLLSLIEATLPGRRKVGMLYTSPPEANAPFRREFFRRGLKLRELKAGSALPLFEALQDTLHSNKVLLAQPDAAIYNSSSICNILRVSYCSNVSLIGFTENYVKSGALCAVYSTSSQIASQAADLIQRYSKTHAFSKPQYPQKFEVMVNHQVALSHGLTIKSAAVLHDEISAQDKGRA